MGAKASDCALMDASCGQREKMEVPVRTVRQTAKIPAVQLMMSLKGRTSYFYPVIFDKIC